MGAPPPGATQDANSRSLLRPQVKIWFQNRRTKWKKAELEAAAQKAAAARQSGADDSQPDAGADAKVPAEADGMKLAQSPAASLGDSPESRQPPVVSDIEKPTVVAKTAPSEKKTTEDTVERENPAGSPAAVLCSEDKSGISTSTGSDAALNRASPAELSPKNPISAVEKSPSPAPSSDGEAGSASANSSRGSTPAPPAGRSPQAELLPAAGGGASVRPVGGRLLASALGAGVAAGGRHRSGIAKLERLVFQREREAALCGES